MSIAALVAIRPNRVDPSGMGETKKKRGKVTAENLQEAARLKSLWDNSSDARRERGVHSQGAFGAEFGVGGQAAVGFFLNGHTALSLKAARGFAKGLQCQISDFSERLAQADAAAWPFALVDRGRYEALSPEARGAVQLRMLDAIAELERGTLKNGTDR